MYGICVLSFWTQKKNKFYFSIHKTFQSCTNVFINDRRTIIAVRFRRRLIKNVSQFSCRNQSKKMLFSVSTKTHYSASCKGSYSLTPAWVATTPLRPSGGTRIELREYLPSCDTSVQHSTVQYSTVQILWTNYITCYIFANIYSWNYLFRCYSGIAVQYSTVQLSGDIWSPSKSWSDREKSKVRLCITSQSPSSWPWCLETWETDRWKTFVVTSDFIISEGLKNSCLVNYVVDFSIN